MGNYRFRFSDMIPNAWFYKLKYTSKSRKQNITRPTNKKHQHASPSSSSTTTSSSGSSWIAAPGLSSKTGQPHLSQQRKSYYFRRDLSTPPPHDHEHTIYDHAATDTRSSNASNSEPPTSSSKKKRITGRNRPSSNCTRSTPCRVVGSSVSAGCSCRSTIESAWTKPDSTPEDYPNSTLDSSSSENEYLVPPEFCSSRVANVSYPETSEAMLSWSASCHCRADNDIIIDMKNKPLNSNLDDELPNSKLDGFNTVSQIDLPPIITKPSKFCGTTKEMAKERETTHEPARYRRSSVKFEERSEYGSLSVKVMKEDNILNCSPNFSKEQKTTSSPARRFLVNSPGVKLRTNSPRIASKRIQAGRKSLSSSRRRRRSVSESFAVVKSSEDPQRDFRESMVEMIVENNICASKDLEDLLACYLSLNSDEYHDLIIRIFKQIWFDIVDVLPN